SVILLIDSIQRYSSSLHDALPILGVHRRHPAAPDDRRTQRLGPRRAGGGRAHGPARSGAVSYPVGWAFVPAYRPFRCGGAPVDVRGGPCLRFTAGGDRRVAGTCPVLRVVGRRRGGVLVLFLPQ